MFTNNIFAMQVAIQRQQEILQWFANERMANQALHEVAHNDDLIHKPLSWLKCWIARWTYRLTAQDSENCWQATNVC